MPQTIGSVAPRSQSSEFVMPYVMLYVSICYATGVYISICLLCLLVFIRLSMALPVKLGFSQIKVFEAEPAIAIKQDEKYQMLGRDGWTPAFAHVQNQKSWPQDHIIASAKLRHIVWPQINFLN